MLTLDDCLRLVRERRPDLPLDGAVLAGDAWHNAVVLTGDRVFRFPRGPVAAATIEVEVKLLPALAPRLPVGVPRFDVSGVLDDGVTRWVGYRRIPGAPLEPALLESPRGGVMAGQVAGFLTALHAISAREGRELGLAETWRDDLAVLADRAYADVVPRLAGDAATRLAAAIARLADPAGVVPAPVHGDLSAGHVLHEPARGVVTGVVDWGEAHVGDPAIDLAWCAGAARVTAAYDPPEGYDGALLAARARAYAAVQPVHGVLYGLDTGQDDHVTRNLGRLA